MGTYITKWINVNMDKQSHAQKSIGWNWLSIFHKQRQYRWSLGVHT